MFRVRGVNGRQRIIVSGQTKVASNLVMRDAFAIEQCAELLVLMFEGFCYALQFNARLHTLTLKASEFLL